LPVVAEFYGVHTETHTKIILEQREPLTGAGRVQNPVMPHGIKVFVETLLIGSLSLETELTVNTGWSNPIILGADPQFAYAHLYGVHTSTDITLIPNFVLSVHAVQHEPIISNWKNVICYPDLLLGTGVQWAIVPEAGSGVVISAGILEATADLQTPAIAPIKIPIIIAELLVAESSLETADPAFDYTVLADELIGLASLATPTLIPHIRMTFTVDGLEAWGGLQSPTIGQARPITVSAGWLPAIGILRTPPYIGRTIVYLSTLVGTGKIKKVGSASFATTHKGEKPEFYYRDHSGVHPVFH
jgi:hypothetical protein